LLVSVDTSLTLLPLRKELKREDKKHNCCRLVLLYAQSNVPQTGLFSAEAFGGREHFSKSQGASKMSLVLGAAIITLIGVVMALAGSRVAQRW
jgi:hypothetical protein